MFRKIITYLTIYSFMFSNVCWAAMITPDGRTQTTVNVNGHVYDVTTSTVSGQNAFNSFSNFDVYKGTTVNLYLPGSTLNLINLVRDGKTNIDGILNSIKNGKIGGNVFILNPHGIAIGKSGVVNVGSLMLSTPNKEFMDQVIGQDGSISELATKSVLAGDLPINPAGVISVKGKIKALDSVAVRAGGVVNAGEILANLKPTQASDIVNTGGLDIDAPLAFKDGKIGVFAENDVVNAGTIKADAGGSGQSRRHRCQSRRQYQPAERLADQRQRGCPSIKTAVRWWFLPTIRPIWKKARKLPPTLTTVRPKAALSN